MIQQASCPANTTCRRLQASNNVISTAVKETPRQLSLRWRICCFIAVLGLEIGNHLDEFLKCRPWTILIGIIDFCFVCLRKDSTMNMLNLPRGWLKAICQTKPEDICLVCSFFDTLALIHDEINTLWGSRSTPTLTKLVQVRFTSNEMIYIDLNDVREGYPLRYILYCTVSSFIY